jgi:hypothetical protein
MTPTDRLLAGLAAGSVRVPRGRGKDYESWGKPAKRSLRVVARLLNRRRAVFVFLWLKKTGRRRDAVAAGRLGGVGH